MVFKGIGRTFSTENEQQYETIGAFWDSLSAEYGLYRQNWCGCVYSRRERERKLAEKA